MKTISGKYSAYPFIRSRQDFRTKSGNFKGFNYGDGSYKVWSYATVIAEYINGVWYINDTKYSVETAKQQQIVAESLGYDFWINDTIHIDHLYRGTTRLWEHVKGSVTIERESRIRANA